VEKFPTLPTSGEGIWSDRITEIPVIGIEIDWINDENTYGDLCVYFNKKDWDVTQDGLIYTDPLFLECLKAYLQENGITTADMDYSEQGMQGRNFVHFDIDELFLATAPELVADYEFKKQGD